jgi:signal transduction histidine kinase
MQDDGDVPSRTEEIAQLRRLVTELRDAVRARDDFIAIAAHELRNPMTPIAGFVDLALAIAQEPASHCPERLITALQRVQVLIENYLRRAEILLDVSRIGSGNLRLEPSEIDLSALIRAIAGTHAPAAARVGSDLELAIEDGIVALLDRVAVEQVVDNLLSNACKFGAGRPVSVRLRSTGASARIEVQDRGIGISAEDRARIFGRFEQVMMQHQGTGFGLGLWVAGRLVQAMGGEISVEGAAGQGSTFGVTLPLRRPGAEGVT